MNDWMSSRYSLGSLLVWWKRAFVTKLLYTERMLTKPVPSESPCWSVFGPCFVGEGGWERTRTHARVFPPCEVPPRPPGRHAVRPLRPPPTAHRAARPSSSWWSATELRGWSGKNLSFFRRCHRAKGRSFWSGKNKFRFCHRAKGRSFWGVVDGGVWRDHLSCTCAPQRRTHSNARMYV